MPDIGSIKKRHHRGHGILPGLREDVALCMASECSTTYPCDGRLLADFIDEIVPDLRKIAEGDLSGEEAAAVAKEILSQIRL